MNPGIDLQIAISGGGKAQLNRAIRADKGLLTKTRGIFDAYFEQPLAYWPAAQHTFRRLRYIIFRVHCIRHCTSLLRGWMLWLTSNPHGARVGRNPKDNPIRFIDPRVALICVARLWR
jgi:hypothetical protein